METTNTSILPKERVIEIAAMHKDDDILRIGCREEHIDFGKCSIHIKVYFDGELFHSDFLKLAVFNQPQRTVYQVNVPKKASRATLILSTIGNEDLSLIDFGFSKSIF